MQMYLASSFRTECFVVHIVYCLKPKFWMKTLKCCLQYKVKGNNNQLTLFSSSLQAYQKHPQDFALLLQMDTKNRSKWLPLYTCHKRQQHKSCCEILRIKYLCSCYLCCITIAICMHIVFHRFWTTDRINQPFILL